MLSCAFPWNLLHTPSALAPRSDPILAIARENLGLTEGLGEISAFLGSPFGSRQVPYAQSSSKEDVSSPRSPRSFFPGDACEATGTAFPGSCRKPSTATPTATLPADPASYIAAPRRRPSPGQASASLRRHLPARPPALRLRGACRGAAAVPSLLPERPPRHRHRHRPAQRPRRRSLQVSGTGPGSGLGQGTAVPVCPPCPADSPRAAAPLPLQPGRSAAEYAFLGAGEGQHRGQADGLAWSGLSLIIVSIRSSTKFRGVCASAPGAAS